MDTLIIIIEKMASTAADSKGLDSQSNSSSEYIVVDILAKTVMYQKKYS
jgi:hypothetical protein